MAGIRLIKDFPRSIYLYVEENIRSNSYKFLLYLKRIIEEEKKKKTSFVSPLNESQI